MQVLADALAKYVMHASRQAGTRRSERRFYDMKEPTPILIENAIEIAWNYLKRSGELGDPEHASEILLNSVREMVSRGERRGLMLSNKAISEYQRISAERRAAHDPVVRLY